MSLRDELQELRRVNRDEVDSMGAMLGIIAAMVSVIMVVLVPMLYGEFVYGDMDWVETQFWWVFFAIVVAIGWSIVAVPDMVKGKFRRHILMLRKELDNGLWFYVTDDSTWEQLHELQSRMPLLSPLNAARPDTIPEQVKVAATYHRTLMALNRRESPGAGAFTSFSSCTLFLDRVDGNCLNENCTLGCMGCGGLIPAVILWPLAIWPLARYLEYKAAVDEFCRFLLVDGGGLEEQPASEGEGT